MKKLFLIPLMALMCSVMAWAEDVHVSTFAALKQAVEQGSATTIYLDADITYRSAGANNGVNIKRSVTIDGQGHSLTGYAGRNNASNGTFFSLNHGLTAQNAASYDSLDVVIKNLNIYEELLRAIETRGKVRSLTIENCYVESKGSGYQQTITIGGNQASKAKINIINSTIAAKAYYPIIAFNPMDLTITDSRFDGWCSVYFKGIDGSEGSHGSTMTATNTYFNAQNFNSGHSNAFGAFPLEDDGINIVLDNCVVDVTAHDNSGIAWQTVFLLSSWSDRANESCSLTVKGANSHIIGDFIESEWDSQVALSMSLEGGSYYGSDFEDAMLSPLVSIATGYHAESVSQGGQDIYRVVKDAAVNPETSTLYDLNDNVEKQGNGDNPATSFELSTGADMTLNQETTEAGYVQVKDNATEGATTVTVGTPTEDQTLVINNGLDVQGNSKVTVLAGSTLQIGEGGIVTSKPENIVIEADETGAASLLLDPTITVNQTPNLTVRMTAKQIGRDNRGDYYWHRFALPLAAGATWTKEGSLGDIDYPTYVYAWDYTANDWKNIAPAEMEPLQGYTLTLASEYIDGAADDGKLNELQDVVYTFKGNLIGNTNRALTFREEGFNFFGNSYTGYMDVKTMLNGLESENIDGTVYMWCNDPANDAFQTYVGVSLYKLNKGRGLENWMKEVAPMQTFILRLRGANSANESVNYAASIWGNPRYDHKTSAPAPRRRVAAISEDTYMEIAVKAANGKGDRVDFTEAANNSDAFESGYDVEKYMNSKGVNLYSTIDGMNYSSVVTDNIEGKTLSLKTNNEIAYTISFKNVEGAEYALLDKVTNQVIAIEEGTTYEFAAQPNSTVEGRFEIVNVAKVATGIENAEVKANVKGIYSITGMYLGEDFEALPAGVYVVNGVKIVK